MTSHQPPTDATTGGIVEYALLALGIREVWLIPPGPPALPIDVESVARLWQDSECVPDPQP